MTVTRDEWAARPLAERRIAAEAWCEGWNDAIYGDPEGRAEFSVESPSVIDVYALDLPDIEQAAAEIRYWQRCPVCEGHGIIDGGFYLSYPGCVGVPTAAAESCRQCGGKGMIVTPRKGE